MKPIPFHLAQALSAICCNPGEDIYFALGYLSKSTARAYLSKLRGKALAYSYVSNGTTEVWPTEKGLKADRLTPSRVDEFGSL